MVLESNGYGVREQRLWCQRVTIIVLESNGYGVCLYHLEVGESDGDDDTHTITVTL
jgi:hypothetical protein